MRKRRPDNFWLVVITSLWMVALLFAAASIIEYGVSSAQYVLVFTVGVGLLVLSMAWLVAAQNKYERQHEQRLRARQRHRRAEREAGARRPADFGDRLAHYLHRDECDDEPEPRYQSKMPFWCRVEVLTRIGPRSRGQIRMLLERIRRAVHGRQNGHG